MSGSIRITTLALAVLSLVLPSPGSAATVERPGDWCGTHPTLDSIVLAEHRFHERQRQRDRESRLRAQSGPLIQAAARPQVSQEGDVVVVVDDGSIIRPPNESDVSGKGFRMQFKKKKGYKITRKPGGVGGGLGERVSLGDDDSVRVPFEKGFKFKFFGKNYSAAYINSDGNITFGEGDNASTARDLGRTVAGPPRIMAYFVDLNPEQGGDVYVKFLGRGKMQVTWDRVPEFQQVGSGDPNTFSVILSRKGHLEFKFGEITQDEGIVGISPGGGGAVRLLDLSEDVPITVPEQAIAEVFGSERTVDETFLAQTYYQHYPDDVQQIALFYDFPLQLLGGGAVAYHFTTKNDVKGIGYKNFRTREIFDNSDSLGSDGVLEGFANMGYVLKYGKLGDLRGTLSNLGVFIHEIGHQWLTRIFFREGRSVNPDLQENGGHWSFVTDTDASFMQGNDIRDNGDGTFLTLPTPETFNDMDLYIMGFLPPGQVSDLFYVRGSSQPSRQLPEWDVSFRGERVDVSIDDVIREEGAREPSSDDSPKTTRIAMVLLVQEGQTPDRRAIDKVQEFVDKSRKEWSDQTGGVGSFDFSVAPN